MNERLSTYLHFNMLGDLKVSKSELTQLMMAIHCYKEELREKNKSVVEGYKKHVDILVDKLNEVKEKIKELEKEDCAITSVNKVQQTIDELSSFLQKN